jgi:hypothetical protein
MKANPSFLILGIFFFGIVSSHGQSNANNFWQLIRGSDPIYVVRLNAITSASIHDYVVGGTVKVSEVTIGTQGSTQARFYVLQPISESGGGGVGGLATNLTQRAQDAAERATNLVGGTAVWKGVVKDYPATTHAHTVEYRIESKEKLQGLLKSLTDSLTSGRGDSFKLD